ncbi:hypothetical protein [Flectobacillus major]|jgi:hypothetical protein|uniref:hypothetical protein n=1 Tax=Flectobacillus major TaxID=103 RepID=UPI00047CD04D|nr:hypothetical protein [Flectobacillus major]
MKKIILSSALLALSLLTFSFKNADKTTGVYDVQTELNTLNTGLAKSFSSAHTSKSDKDVVWSEWHKDWTQVVAGSDLEILDHALSNY